MPRKSKAKAPVRQSSAEIYKQLQNDFNVLNKDTQSKIKTIYGLLFPNKLTDSAEFLQLHWVPENLERIEKVIEDKYSNLNSKKGYYNALTHLFKSGIFKDKSLFDKYKGIAFAYKDEAESQEDKQELDTRELNKWLSFREILELRRKLKASIKSWLTYRKWFVLSLYVLQPPVHSDYCDMKIIKDKKTWQQDRKNNYYWIENEQNHWIIISHDKTSGKKGTSQIKVSDALRKLMISSLQEYPRDYVVGTKPLKPQSFLNILYSMGLGVDVLRSAYITNYYQGITIQEKKLIAQKMRHSYATAERNYFKIVPGKDLSKVEPEEIETPKAPDAQPPPLPTPAPKPDLDEPTPKPKTFNRKEWAKQYRAKNKDRIASYMKSYQQFNNKQILRAKLLWELNSGMTHKPKPESIEKYNLIFDEETKRWK